MFVLDNENLFALRSVDFGYQGIRDAHISVLRQFNSVPFEFKPFDFFLVDDNFIRTTIISTFYLHDMQKEELDEFMLRFVGMRIKTLKLCVKVLNTVPLMERVLTQLCESVFDVSILHFAFQPRKLLQHFDMKLPKWASAIEFYGRNIAF